MTNSPCMHVHICARQAYLPKKRLKTFPKNFGQHFSPLAMPTHTPFSMDPPSPSHGREGAPRRFFSRSDVEVAKSHFTPLKSAFSLAGGAQNALLAALRRIFRKSGRICVVFNEIDHGFHLLDDRHELHLMARADSRTHDITRPCSEQPCMTPAALALCQCCRRHDSCTDRSIQGRQHHRHLCQRCCRRRRLPRGLGARRRRACTDLLCTRRSRVLAKMVTWQRGTAAFCHSRTQAPALGARHCQRKSTELSRLRLSPRRAKMVVQITGRPLFGHLLKLSREPLRALERRQAGHNRLALKRTNPGSRPLTLNTRVTKDVDPTGGLLRT